MSVSIVGTPTSLLDPTGATTYNVNTPSGSAAGDLVVIVGMYATSTTTTPTPSDTGFTATTTYGSGTSSTLLPKVGAWYKELTAAAPSTYTFTTPSTNRIGGFAVFILRRSDASLAWAIDVQGVGADSSTPYVAPAVSMTSAGVALVGTESFGNTGYTITSPGSPFVEAWNKPGPGTSTPFNAGGYEVRASAGTTGTWSFTASAGGTFALISIGVSHAVPTAVHFTSGMSTISINGSGTLRLPKHLGTGTSTISVHSSGSFNADKYVHFTNGVSTISLHSTGTLNPNSLNSIEFGVGTSTIAVHGAGALHVSTHIHFLNGVSTVTFDSTAELNVVRLLFDISLESPSDGESVVTVSPTLSLTLTQTEPANTLANVEVQLSASEDFSTTLLDYHFDTTNVYGTIETIPLTTTILEDGNTYYWRARVKRDDGTYDPWTEPTSFIVDLTIGDVAEYILWGDVVDSSDVTPHLWYIADPRVFSHGDDTITIVGMGFGDKDVTVRLDEEVLPLVSNTIVPSDDEGLSDARVIGSIGNDVNVEHDIIVASIPDDVETPGGNVTVETE